MNWSIEQKTRATFVGVILLVILTGFLAYRSTINFITANQSVTHTRQVLDELQGTLSSVQDVQAAQLSYLLTGNELYFNQYTTLDGQVTQHLATLRSLTADEPTQQDRLNDLQPAVTRWLALIAQVILTQQQSGVEQARTLVRGVQTNTLMAQIRTRLGAMTSDEQSLLAQNRLTVAAQREQSTLATFAIITLLMVALLTFGYTRIHRNLVARHRAEQLLQQERALLRAVIDTLPDYIYVKDTNLRLVLANQAHLELLGAKNADEVMGKTDTDLFPAGLAPQYVEDEKAILKSGLPLVNHEEPTASSSGEQKIVLTTKMPIRNATGEITQIVGISHDITARKLAEEEIKLLNQNLSLQSVKLEAANKELEAFSYSVSHDLRAPLRAIDGFSRILMDDYAESLAPEAVRYLEKVRANARRMGELVDDLLRFSRLSRQSIIKQHIQPAELVNQIFKDDLRDDCENRQVEIVMGDMPACEADPLLLRQVYVNLLSNALKFTSKREIARIEVGSLLENGQVVYFVKDNGAGFDQQYVHKLFGVFQRLHRIEDYAGTGVGLAIVQRVIVRHGGQIWAEGVIDEGAAFYFTLREIMATQVVEILLIEDNPDDEELTLHALKKVNLVNRIDVVRDGAEALEYVFCTGAYSHRMIENGPRLILLDLKLPKVDGLEVLERIKSDARTRMIPVVVLTSSREESDIVESYQMGVNSYIVKPVDFEQFVQSIGQVGMYWVLINQPSRI